VRSGERSKSLKRPAPVKRARIAEWLALSGACAVIGPALLAPGCSSTGGSHSGAQAPNTGLDALFSESVPRQTISADTLSPEERPGELNLSEVFDRAAARKTAKPAPAPTLAAPVESEAVADALPAMKPSPVRPVPEDAQARVQRLAKELREALSDRAGTRPTFADAAAATALDAVAKETDAGRTKPDLPPPQRKVLDAFRSVVLAISSGSAAAGDPRSAAEAFTSAAKALDESKAVHIRRAVLCSRVSGFGRYDAMGHGGFVAGRPARLIVYTELERFSHRPARDGDPGRTEAGMPASGEELLAVELTQELVLWHDADGSAQWRQPEQTVVEVSRNRRNDFYLVQQVELPANLSVGKYNLKVSVKDRASGAVDEAQIPIVIVADASLTLVPPSR